MKETQSQIEDITIGSLILRKQFENLFLFPNLKAPYESNEKILVIYAISDNLTRITCYPVPNNSILWKLKIQLNELHDDTLRKITNLIMDFESIHTTGLSKKGNFFKVENYLVSPKTIENLDEIKKSIKKINGCIHCEIVELID